MTRLGAVSRTFQCIAMALAMPVLVAVPAAPKSTNSATDVPGAFTFTVIGNVPDRAKDVAPIRALLNAIDAEHPAFVVHLGNLKGRDKACSDTLLEACRDLLDNLIAPVIYIPGDRDWSGCQCPAAGSFDPVERLLRLCELFCPDDSTLGQRTVTVMCQSDQTKFHSYCENMRWTMNDVLFVILNVPGDNNNYRTASGRNSGYEDRLEANRQWLTRASAVMHQRKMAGIVVMMQADSFFEDGREWCRAPSLFDGLLRHRSHDGYLTLRRQMRSFIRDYDGAVLLIHGTSQTFMLDRPLKDEDGRPDTHVMRARTYSSPVPDHWLEVFVTPGRTPLFHIRSCRLDNMPAPTPGIAPTPAQ